VLDELIPSYDFCERHSTRMSATPAAALAAVKAATLREMPGVGPLFALRGIQAARDRPLVDELLGLGFDRLVDEEDELVLGYVGQPWRPGGGSRVRPASPEAWAAFDEPGYAKAALFFRGVDGRPGLATSLRALLGARPAVERPHPAELATRGPPSSRSRRLMLGIEIAIVH
jgi:hypothetical protein